MDLSQLYLVCFVLGLLFAMVSAFFAEFFGGHDGHAHFHLPHHDSHVETGPGPSGMPGVSPLSPTIIASFVTAFGGIGLILRRFGPTSSPWIGLSLALAGGFVLAAIVMMIFNKIFHATQSSSEGQVHQLVGHSATVITPISPGGVGEIAYVQAGTRYTAPARAESAEPIAAGATVWIVRISGTQFFVTCP